MAFYISGVLFAFIVNVARVILAVSDCFSVRTKNFNKVKMYYDISTGGYSVKKASKVRYAMVFVELLIVSPLLSWLSVLLFAYAARKRSLKKLRLPEKMKEINFKLSSSELPKEKVKESLNELAFFYGLPAIDLRTSSDDEDYDVQV